MGQINPTAGFGVFWLLAALLPLAAASPPPVPVTVLSVADGDTVTLRSPSGVERVRLAAVDAPERGQPYAAAARRALADRILGRRLAAETHGRDRYGRPLVVLIAPDGERINHWLVARGWAWHYRQYSRDPELDRLEAEARRTRRGLWADPAPLAPWEFRRARRPRPTVAAPPPAPAHR